MLDLVVREQSRTGGRGPRKRGQGSSSPPCASWTPRRRALLVEVEGLKKRATTAPRRSASSIKRGRRRRAAARDEMRRMGERIAALEGELGRSRPSCRRAVERLPNLPHATVPDGHRRADNVVVADLGRAATPSPSSRKAHWDLGARARHPRLRARAPSIAGARFALLHGRRRRGSSGRSSQFMLDLHTREHGYLEVLPPFLVNAEALFGPASSPSSRRISSRRDEPERPTTSIPTAEVPVTNIHADEILERDAAAARLLRLHPVLPQRGRQLRQGRARPHPPAPVRQGRAGALRDAGGRPATQLELLTGARRGGAAAPRAALPGGRCSCTGDLGFAAAKTYDLEVWLPGAGTSTARSRRCSNFGDFQARRAGIRYRRGPGRQARAAAHAERLGLAVGRTLVAILENYQQEDGTVSFRRRCALPRRPGPHPPPRLTLVDSPHSLPPGGHH